ncbi:MAG: hypothetical protein K0S55_1900 [Clostridia bacterium]|jgi:hypothetical protein|nr:hypothetical protein [Clostridia bacterium]
MYVIWERINQLFICDGESKHYIIYMNKIYIFLLYLTLKYNKNVKII